MHPILILLVGMATVLGAIVLLRLNAFLALIGAAILVSLLAPGEAGEKIVRVAEAFGRTAGSIGIVIALAAIIGKAMMDSGAADRVVLAFLAALGEKRGGGAMLSSGFTLAIPVFFDTVFYLLVPLARSMYTRTGRNYLKYIMAIAAGGAAAHTLIPPTPGPLVVAGTLGVDVGTMLMMGIIVALPAASVGLVFSAWVDRRMPIPLRPDASGVPEPEPRPANELPGLMTSVLPILLPVVLISANTIANTMTTGTQARDGVWQAMLPYTATLGNANLALLLSAIIAILVYYQQRRPTRLQLSAMVESSLMSGGVIILITAAGGAFGAMLQAAEIGPAIQAIFAGDGPGSGLVFLFLAFSVASLIKIAQGSSTVAMITGAGMMAAMITGAPPLPFHTVYIALAIASGALVGSWMNDSGFWVFTKMGGLTEIEALKSWTPLLAILGITSMIMTTLLALLLPMN
jgi:gluconate:H+ symporter, GntP family